MRCIMSALHNMFTAQSVHCTTNSAHWIQHWNRAQWFSFTSLKTKLKLKLRISTLAESFESFEGFSDKFSMSVGGDDADCAINTETDWIEMKSWNGS